MPEVIRLPSYASLYPYLDPRMALLRAQRCVLPERSKRNNPESTFIGSLPSAPLISSDDPTSPVSSGGHRAQRIQTGKRIGFRLESCFRIIFAAGSSCRLPVVILLLVILPPLASIYYLELASFLKVRQREESWVRGAQLTPAFAHTRIGVDAK